MGKTPETLDGKLLKVRENKLRRTAAKQGVKVAKLWQHGRYLLFENHHALGTPQHRGGGFTLAEAEQFLADRQRRPVADVIPLHVP